jgi:hypothetical protein
MKNIHVIQTDKPSRLAILGMSNTLQLFDKPITFHTFGRSPQNIYITNSEEIKEGDWVYSEAKNTLFKVKSICNTSAGYLLIEDDVIMPLEINEVDCKKIILTTDQDLIKDGVQAIDDNFLEWFVNNPSCEEVEVKITDRDDNGYGIPFGGIFYNIFIPKEEPKQPFYCSDKLELDDNEKCTTQCDVCSGKPKQETLEEAPKEKLDFYQQGFADGFKIQQERSYSEEEVLELLNGYDNHIQENFDPSKTILSTKEWFEQNKKK